MANPVRSNKVIWEPESLKTQVSSSIQTSSLAITETLKDVASVSINIGAEYIAQTTKNIIDPYIGGEVKTLAHEVIKLNTTTCVNQTEEHANTCLDTSAPRILKAVENSLHVSIDYTNECCKKVDQLNDSCLKKL